MKYMIEYTVRNSGLTGDQNFSNFDALLKAFGKWKPDEGLTVHAFVSTLSHSGYVLVEANDPKVVASFTTKFTFWNDIKVVPVADIAELVPIAAASSAWARNASAN